MQTDLLDVHCECLFRVIDDIVIMFRIKKLRRVIDGYIGIVSR